jgi:hypothetical protein
MIYIQKYSQLYAKPDFKASNTAAYERYLNELYSSMTLDKVMDELGYMLNRDWGGQAVNMVSFIRSYDNKTCGKMLRVHDRQKFKIMYREWYALQPLIPLKERTHE